MATINQPISMARGEGIALHFQMRPVEDITGWVISFTVAETYDSTVKLFQATAVNVNAPGGLFDVLLPRNVTLNIASGSYLYDVWKTNPGSERQLAVGPYELLGSVY